MNKKPRVIVFDAFGTLVKMSKGRLPYLKLMKWFKDHGRKSTAHDAKIIQTNSLKISELAVLLGKEIPDQLADELNHDLQLDLNSIELYEDVISTLQDLKDQGFQIALCSNLAMPYGERLKQLLPSIFDAVLFSYEVATIKPEPMIYHIIGERFSCQMSDILFIGDHPILDVEVPISLGMQARLIDRNKNQNLADTLSDFFQSE